MKTKLAIIAALLLNMCTTHVSADNHRRLIVTEYAVPVAVPVASYAPFTYSTSQQQQQAFNEPPRSAEDMLYDKFVKRLAASQQPRATAFSQSCAKCHAKGDSDSGKPQFSTLDALNSDQLDECMDAVLSDRMPKGGKLTADQAGKLLKEFSGERMRRKSVSKPKASVDVPPAPPSPEEIGESQ